MELKNAMGRSPSRRTPPALCQKPKCGVRVTQNVDDPSPMKLVYDPTHPDANEEGYVEMPNVDTEKEITDAS